MSLWFVFALMTAAAIFAVLWPLGRGAGPTAGGLESAVYKDQLAEVDRDLANGQIAAAEAEAARVEIGRRLLAAADAETGAPAAVRPVWRRSVAVTALAGMPIVAAALYLPFGSPRLGDFPLAERTRLATASQPLENLVAQVEAHLEKNPADGRGWTVLAPVLGKLGRFDDAVRAYRNVITHAGDNAARRADLGEAITLAANGVVTTEAKAEFETSVALDPDEVKGRYFLGLAAEQDGRAADAATIWRKLLDAAPENAPWRPLLQTSLARVGGPGMPALSDSAVANAGDMTADDRSTMIRGMVDRLASRLKQDGSDIDGWLRLVRAYIVLGERDKARDAQGQARAAIGADAERLKTLNDGFRSLGLEG